MAIPLGVALLSIGVLFVWSTLRNVRPIDELRRAIGAREAPARPIA